MSTDEQERRVTTPDKLQPDPRPEREGKILRHTGHTYRPATSPRGQECHTNGVDNDVHTFIDFILMKQHLFILPFFIGFVSLVLSAPHYYFLIWQGKTWGEAQGFCRAKYTDLAAINTGDHMLNFQNEVQIQKFSSSAWIGLYDDMWWHWSMGGQLVPQGTELWAPGQPDNMGGNETCGALNRSAWSDQQCNLSYAFVCFDSTKIGDQMYIYISQNKSWWEAQSYCITHHTDLASARTATENSIIASLNPGLVWIGLYRDGWRFTDGTSVSNISWMSGKPDNALGKQDCAYINNGQAVDAQCSDIMPFFCYSIIQRKIIKVKVQSSQNVNDPALKEAMLKKIKQKLIDQGMQETIIVKWKTQPDGNVFCSFTRSPQSHTCGCVLEVPNNYTSYPELAEEFIQ
ncbi:macrophage mannose receptor 1-like [Tachysurus fulvidraco]|uniref:macrophage mannose receptor 1-like n=1 Tax=Tachysurus fulvidraco TaxID=1234273 RepID=UPI001FEDA108|nr:macrophage mannose receptor 1-like [Tachysurus fulvidraco]